MKAEIGITKENLTKVGHVLNQFLADEFLLYTKTRNAHWNVEGPDFYEKHQLFEKQYEQLDDIMDSVAERIRSLGHYPVATLSGFLALTHLSEKSSQMNDGMGFVKVLLADHESIIIRIRENLDIVGVQLKDAGSTDFITGIMETHEKMAWVLRAHLG